MMNLQMVKVKKKYDINSGEDNNSASLDMGKVISFLDFLLFM